MDDGCGSRVADAARGSNKRRPWPDLVDADEQRRGQMVVPLNAAIRFDSIPVGVDREGGVIAGAVAMALVVESCRRAWAPAEFSGLVRFGPVPRESALGWGAPM